ncbi:MAG: hypothetical protein IPP72_11550 [Chitinophagaceae bacterium]|nr:hypothetical protein [Chitinophagaceae bacterium]
MIKKLFNSKAALPVIIVLLIAINWLAAVFHSRIDFTNEKDLRYPAPPNLC